MGRPKKENPKNRQIRIRLNEYEFMVLSEMADILGVTKSDLIRQGLGLLRCTTMTEEQQNLFIDRTMKEAKKIHSQKRQRS